MCGVTDNLSIQGADRSLLRRVFHSTLSFVRATGGTTAVEFSLIALPLLFTILFLMYIGFMVYAVQCFDLTAQKVARQIRIGAVQAAQLTQTQFINQIVCPLLPTSFSCSNVIVNLQPVPFTSNTPNSYMAYTNFLNINQTALVIPPLQNSSTKYCPGQGQQGQGTNSTPPTYVYLQILYPISLGLSLFSQITTTTYNGQQVYLVMSTATFLNEPFSAPASSC